jgi:hypothetical protein
VNRKGGAERMGTSERIGHGSPAMIGFGLPQPSSIHAGCG